MSPGDPAEEKCPLGDRSESQSTLHSVVELLKCRGKSWEREGQLRCQCLWLLESQPRDCLHSQAVEVDVTHDRVIRCFLYHAGEVGPLSSETLTKHQGGMGLDADPVKVPRAGKSSTKELKSSEYIFIV